MDIEETLVQILEEILIKTGLEYDKINVDSEDSENYHINIESDNPSELIGHHGSNIHAIQHILKVLCWKKLDNNQFNVYLDVDNYKKRREERAISIALRKVDFLRKTGRTQSLPPMNPYLRRKVHLHLMGPGFEDVETYSEGENDQRHIILKQK